MVLKKAIFFIFLIACSISYSAQEKPALGMVILTAPPQLFVDEELPAKAGVLVTQVIPTSPADTNGFSEGDIVVSINKAVIQTSEDLLNIVSGRKFDETIKVEFIRNKNKQTIDVTLSRFNVYQDGFDPQSLSGEQLSKLGMYIGRSDIDKSRSLLELAIKKKYFADIQSYGSELLTPSFKGYDPERLKRFSEGLRSFRQTFSEECPECDYLMALYYDYLNVSGNKNAKEIGWEFLQKAEKANFPNAIYHMAHEYQRGNHWVKKDLVKSEDFYKKAIELDVRDAKTDLIEHYLFYDTFGESDAIGVEKLVLSELSPDQSIFRLSRDYLYYLANAQLGSQNDAIQSKAIDLLKYLASKGDADALWSLGVHYEFDDKDGLLKGLNGMPIYANYYWDSINLVKRVDRIETFFRVLREQWDLFDNPKGLYQQLQIMAGEFWKKPEYANEAFTYADWLVSDDSTVKDIDKGLEILKFAANNNSQKAITRLHIFYLRDADKDRFDAVELYSMFSKRMKFEPELAYVDQITFQTYKESSSYDPDAVFKLINSVKDSSKRLYYKGMAIMFGIYDADAKKYGINFPKLAEEIVSYQGYWSSDVRKVIEGIYRGSFEHEYSESVLDALISYYEKQNLAKDKTQALEYFITLVRKGVKDKEKLLTAYDQVKDFSIWSNYHIGSEIHNSRIEAPSSLVISAYAKAINLLINKKGDDYQEFLSDYESLEYMIGTGFGLSINDGDLRRARFFDAAYKELLTPLVATRSEAERRFVEMNLLLQKASLFYESGDVESSKVVGEKVLKQMMSNYSDMFSFGEKLEIIMTGGMLMAANEKYELGNLALKHLYDVSKDVYEKEIEEDPGFFASGQIRGEIYSLYAGNKELADHFRTIRKVSDSDMFSKHSFHALDLVGVNIWRAVHDDDDFIKAHNLLDLAIGRMLKLGSTPRHWEIRFVDKMADEAERRGQHRYASDWRELAGMIYRESLLKRFSSGSRITPLEKKVVSTFLMKMLSDSGVDDNLKFELFQLVQGLGVSQAVDASDLSDKQRLALLSSDMTLTKDQMALEINRPKQKLFTIKDVQSKLDQDQAVLFIASSPTETATWYVTKNDNFLERIDLSAEGVAKLADSVVSSMGKEFNVEASLKLYLELFKSPLSKVSGIKHLRVAPSYELSAMPLIALVTQQDVSTNQSTEDKVMETRGFSKISVARLGNRSKWLIEEVAISVLPSASALRQSQKSNTKKGFIGIGAPVLGMKHLVSLAKGAVAKRGANKIFEKSELHGQLIPLPDAEEELNLFSKKFENSTLYIGDQAKEDAVKNINFANYSVVSFATHAMMSDEVSGMHEPSLVLSLSGNEDGLLTQREILQLKMDDADIVLLSACNTASSSGGNNKETYSGLTSAFMAAGAKNVLVSHWSVISEAAKEITTQMFQDNNNDESYPKRLQHSVKQLLYSPISYKRNPAYWSAFSLVGN